VVLGVDQRFSGLKRGPVVPGLKSGSFSKVVRSRKLLGLKSGCVVAAGDFFSSLLLSSLELSDTKSMSLKYEPYSGYLRRLPLEQDETTGVPRS